MPNWVLGNNVFTSESSQWDMGSGTTSRRMTATLLEPASGSKYEPMWQSGVVKGVNVYIGSNTGTKDLNFQLYRGVYDGVGDSGLASNPITATTLFTVPPGATGYFCMNENDFTRAQRTWVKRDFLGFRWGRGFDLGVVSKITYAICLEYIEEYLFTNGWDDTAEPPILNRNVTH